MLKRLSISNYLLIDALELDLQKGLTIITGETGSGKSIVIGALALAIGERAGAAVQRDATKRCIIELEVDLQGMDLHYWFTAAEIPHERRSILRRQLDPGGRSRAFVNDTPVNLDQLRELGARLVHIHSQHHTQLLNDPGFQLRMVDQLAGSLELANTYSGKYRSWRALAHELEAMRVEEERSRAELDYLTFQLDELDAMRIQEGEHAAIEQELARVEHAEELLQGLSTVETCMTDGSGIGPMLQRAKQALAKPARYDQEVAALLERLSSAWIELKDISDEAERLAGAMTVDPARAQQLRERSDALTRLEQKHRVAGSDDLIDLMEGLRLKVSGIGSLTDRIRQLDQAYTTAGATLMDQARELSEKRAIAALDLAERIEGTLHDLGMPHAKFLFDHRIGEPTPHGIDTMRALFTANKDRAAAPLDKVASGGELSRVMLAMISLVADSQDLPTVIFDEIDTGVSGEVADRVGTLMARMGKDRQVLAITHLPQIASKAETHLLVAKDEVDDHSMTSIRTVTAEERVEALAHMLSGRTLTKAALENARALMGTKRPSRSKST